MCNFKTQQKVVCIRQHSTGLVIVGEHYVIDGLKRGCTHYPLLVNVGIINTEHGCACEKCGMLFNSAYDYFWLDPALFAPIEEIPASHEQEVEKIIKESLTIEV